MALAAGLALSAGTLARGVSLRRKLERREAESARLQRLYEEAGRLRGAVQSYEELGAGGPVELAGLVDAAWPGVVAEVREGAAEPLGGGWRIRRAHVMVAAGSPRGIGRLAEAAGASRPPWTLVECAVTALKEQPGLARVALLFEAIEKAQGPGGPE